MDCRHVDRLLEANLDGRLSGFERVALRQHLRACRVCRAKVDGMSAFAASVEKALACADGPEWHRLTPPAAPMAMLGEPVMTPAPTHRPPSPPRRRRTPWASVGFVLVGAALLAFTVPLGRTPPPSAGWLDEALAVEATRLAAGGHVDLETVDMRAALDWLQARGVPAVTPVALPAAVTVEGAYLAYYGDARVGGLALATPDGPASIHLRAERPAEHDAMSLAASGLEGTTATLGGWQAVVIATAGTSAGSSVVRALAEARAPIAY